MLKPALYYTLEGSAHSNNWPILTVTTEKRGRDGGRRLYGRDEFNNMTHAAGRDTIGRFETIELAEAGRKALRQIIIDHAGPIEKAERELNRLRNFRYTAMLAAVGDLKATPAKHGVAGQ